MSLDRLLETARRRAMLRGKPKPAMPDERPMRPPPETEMEAVEATAVAAFALDFSYDLNTLLVKEGARMELAWWRKRAQLRIVRAEDTTLLMTANVKTTGVTELWNGPCGPGIKRLLDNHSLAYDLIAGRDGWMRFQVGLPDNKTDFAMTLISCREGRRSQYFNELEHVAVQS